MTPTSHSWRKPVWFALLPILLLGGCSIFEHSTNVATDGNALAGRLQESHRQFAAALREPNARHAAQEVGRPWLAGRAQPLAREVTLPAALRENVQTALMFPDNRVDISTLAERITQASGIPVRVQPDALLSADRFLPRLDGGAADASTDKATGAGFMLPSGAHPLPKVLDLAAAHLGIEWRYHKGAIEFFRTESRVFNVRALLLKSSSVASLGRTAGKADGAFATASNTRVESSVQDVMAAVIARLNPFLTRAGLVAAHGDGTSLIVITDTPAALDRVAAFLDRENRALTRRVRLVFEEITVALNDGAEAGIDWSLVYAAARAGAALDSPGSALGQIAGSLTATVDGGPWSGSRAIVRALHEIGTVTRHTSVPLVTLNRRPVTHAVRTTFSWIDRVQTTAVSTSGEGGVAGALPSVSVSQKEETVGQFLTLIPDAQDDGQVLLSIAYDTTVAQPLTSVSFGTGDNAVQVQQLTVDGNGTVQQVELRPGQPMIVSGFDRDQRQADSRRLGDRVPMLFGGSERTARKRETTLVILTAMAEDGF